MESLLSGNKLADELAFFKQQVDILATQKIKYPNSYVQPLERRSKKPTLANVSFLLFFSLLFCLKSSSVILIFKYSINSI